MNTKIRRAYRDRVARGARRLDKIEPGWFKRIDLNHLNMASPCNCIVGQLYVKSNVPDADNPYHDARFDDWAAALFADNRMFGDRGVSVIYGLDLDGEDRLDRDDYLTLKERWVIEIQNRLAAR